MSDVPVRGRIALYWVAVVALVLAGGALAASARGFLASTHLLWLSAACSAVGIVVSIASVVAPPRSR